MKNHLMAALPMSVTQANARRAEVESGIHNEIDQFNEQGGHPRLDEEVAVRVLTARIADFLNMRWGILDGPSTAEREMLNLQAAVLFAELREKARMEGGYDAEQWNEFRDVLCRFGVGDLCR